VADKVFTLFPIFIIAWGLFRALAELVGSMKQPHSMSFLEGVENDSSGCFLVNYSWNHQNFRRS